MKYTIFSRFLMFVGAATLLLVLGVATCAAWYTYQRSQIIKRDVECAHPMRAPDGSMECVQELIPPTFTEKVFNLPPRIPGDLLHSIPNTPPDSLRIGSSTIGQRIDPEVLANLRAEFPPRPPQSRPMLDLLAATTVHPEYVSQMQQSGRVDDHISIDPTLEEVTICGTPFMARKLTYDGIDVVKKLAAMLPATSTPPRTVQEGVCANLISGRSGGEFYDVRNYRITELPVLDVKSYYDSYNARVKYIVTIPQLSFELDAQTGDISEIGGYDGTLSFIGNLRK